ncbi:ROK family protein [Lactiplantibacillus paraplantarum]|uniref:ROK family protein n=1 Tax=Lactiplantibacillus paraplantarum TaxID=60520 RepID=UPI000513B0E7|nr:ROK family protein [Lactiplantibacillus paraplantarum]OAX74798.1 transcriptional regulator [Lactiplantibacillus plantarum]ALO04842.1 transcriptional regulator [Lactiplantibacillus paraplantarum]KGE74251.1 transcriptional regulator [Lactiplantibacillus paraplantarum]MCT4457357.1 ROK family protein [Lactiplantibacillus paraplantarum]RDG08358.1 ROK family protein [Lactiplantibacillus paraplantarum]
MTEEPRYLAVDVGGTNLKYALINRSGQLIQKSRIETPHDCLQHFLNTIEEISQNLKGQLNGVAFSTPGRVDTATDMIYCRNSTLPYLDKVCLPRKLQKLGIPVAVENDGKAAVLAESWLGNLHDVKNGMALVLGTCVGGGIMLDGHLWAGGRRLAGEVSLMPANQTDLTDNGLFGRTGSAVRMITAINTAISEPDLTDGHRAFEAINAGDHRTTEIFQQYAREVASLILNVQTVLDLDRYVIGGGISFQPVLIEAINQQYDWILSQRPWVQSTIARPEIMSSRFHNDANLYGALYRLFNKLDAKHDAPIDLDSVLINVGGK